MKENNCKIKFICDRLRGCTFNDNEDYCCSFCDCNVGIFEPNYCTNPEAIKEKIEEILEKND